MACVVLNMSPASLTSWRNAIKPSASNSDAGFALQSVSAAAQRTLVLPQIAGGKAAEHDLADRRVLFQLCPDGGSRHARGKFDRIAVDAGADAGKRNARERMLRGELERTAIAGGGQPGFAERPAIPHRAHGVDDVTRRQAVTPGDLRIAGVATVQQPAFVQQFRTGGAMNRAIHASPA